MTFLEIAKPLAAMGVPITPVRPGTKKAFLPDFPTTATTDLPQLEAWNKLYSDHNAACVARAEIGGVWFLEVDSPEVMKRIQNDTQHNALVELATFRVRSRPGRGHFYFRHNTLSLALGNISQTYVVGQDWSVRTNREYVVAPGSIHPDTGEPYTALNWGTPIIEAPEWLIGWLLSQKVQKHSAPQGAPAPGSKVQHGSIHGYMLTQAGKLRALGLDQPEIEVALLKLVHDNCEPPIDDSKVVQMSRSICNFPAGEPNAGKALKLNQSASVEQAPEEPPQPDESIDYSEDIYPVFPKWVMEGTSIYEGYVKPYCAVNSRIDYFMWMPAAALLLNYVGTKVSVPLKDWKPSLYLVLIGSKNDAHKSASMKDAMRYMEFSACLQQYSREVKNADGKTIVFEVGSPEGLGTDMQRTNCKNAVLFYDELSALVSKAGIEGSGMNSALLKAYESANFSNSIKNKKDSFNVAPDSYVLSVLTATTTEKFLEQWSDMGGEDSGLDQRFTFVMQPEVLPEQSIHEAVPFNDASLATRELINRAVQQKHFKFYDQTPFKEAQRLYGGRAQIRAEKWALYFAIDLGLTEIDEDCVERGIALARYEDEVKKYLKPTEAKNDEATLQQAIIRALKKKKGTCSYRDLYVILNAKRYGTSLWGKAYFGLVNAGQISQVGKGKPGDPRIVTLLQDI